MASACARAGFLQHRSLTVTDGHGILVLLCSFDYKLRGDIDKQMDAAERAAVKEGRVSPADPAEFATKGPVKHTWWWRLAHVSALGMFISSCHMSNLPWHVLQ